MIFGRRYRVTETLGSGGMADVLKAVDDVLGRTVAVKVLHSRYASDPNFVARFRQEAQAAANLSHPGIVNIYDWGRDNETYYIVMEYVRGTDLKRLIQERGSIDPMKVAEFGAQVCSALAAAHGYDIIHRDIKPHNIVLTPDGALKVMDFGIARAGNTTMTQTGSVLGTAHYVSPEQAQGRPLGPASDLYSLGIVLYELATGKLPFDAETPIAIALKQVNELPVSPRQINPQIPASLEAVIMRALQKDPAARYASAEEMRADLKRVISGDPVSASSGARADAHHAPMEDHTSVMPAVSASGRPPVGSSRAPHIRPVPHRRSPWPWIAAIVALLAAGIGIAWGTGVLDLTPRVIVPDLRGMTVEQATVELEAVGLVLGPITEQSSDEHESGEVFDQSPEPNATVPDGTEVALTVSTGIEQVEVPDVVGMVESDAISTLRTAGLQHQPQREFRRDVPTDDVFGQDPPAGQMVARGSIITISVSRGAKSLPVPSVVGRTAEEATGILEREGFVVTRSEEYSTTVERGLVISQMPDANTVILSGEAVRIRVSLGREMISVPDVIGLSEAEAREKITAARLQPVIEYQVSPDDGVVLTQDPIPGASAERNSSVTIWVGVIP